MLSDLLPALRKYISDNIADVTDLVFSEELPVGQAISMPRKCIVLKEAGGYGNRGFLTVERTRVQIRCYGATPYEAREVRREVHELLKTMRAQILTGTDAKQVKVLSAIEASGPMSLRDPDTQWPYTIAMWMVMARSMELAS